MFEHHLKTLENLYLRFEQNPEILAFIVNGSVARDEARDDSDVDFH